MLSYIIIFYEDRRGPWDFRSAEFHSCILFLVLKVFDFVRHFLFKFWPCHLASIFSRFDFPKFYPDRKGPLFFLFKFWLKWTLLNFLLCLDRYFLMFWTDVAGMFSCCGRARISISWSWPTGPDFFFLKGSIRAELWNFHNCRSLRWYTVLL